MKEVFCRDLCDVFAKKSITDAFFDGDMTVAGHRAERIYIGSYFCGNMFLLLGRGGLLASLADRARRASLRITLVLPDLAERHLDAALALVDEALSLHGDVVDEVSVGDIPLLAHLRKLYPHLQIAAGRLINKTLRDVRDADFFNRKEEPKVLSPYYLDLFRKYGISCIEIDNFSKEIVIPDIGETEIAVHLPFVYATSCKICEFASVGKEISKKFRPSDTCGYECLSRAVEYGVQTAEGRVTYYKYGCGVYFKNEELRMAGAENVRYIYNGFGGAEQ